MKSLWILGPGSSIARYEHLMSSLREKETLAYQRVFPNCYTYYDIIPRYWTGYDPNGLIEGLEFLVSVPESERELFANMELLLPHFCSGEYSTFRKYCGTTPLGRTEGAWENYLNLIQKVRDLGYTVTVIDSYTTKKIELEERFTNDQFKQNDIFNKDSEYLRFMVDKPIFGTVRFDSESVIGHRYRWGLENKLSVQAFPLAYHLGFKKVYVAGFDLIGSRFYDNNICHPWDDHRQKNQDAKLIQQIPLSLIKQWVDWEPLHGMKIYSVVEDQYTLINQALPYQPFKDTLEEKGE